MNFSNTLKNRILIYNGFNNINNNIDFDLLSNVMHKTEISKCDYVYSNNISKYYDNKKLFNDIIYNFICCLFIFNTNTYKLTQNDIDFLFILELHNIKVISNININNSINYYNLDELVKIIDYLTSYSKYYGYNSTFLKNNVRRFNIATYNSIYTHIQKKLLGYEKDLYDVYIHDNKQTVFIGIDDDNSKEITSDSLIFWIYENTDLILSKINKYKLHHNENYVLLKEHYNILHKNKINVKLINNNLFLNKKYNSYPIVLQNINTKNIICYNNNEIHSNAFIKNKFIQNGIFVSFYDDFNQNMQFKIFIDFSCYHNSNFDYLIKSASNNNIILFTNNLIENKNIHNFDNIDNLVEKIKPLL